MHFLAVFIVFFASSRPLVEYHREERGGHWLGSTSVGHDHGVRLISDDHGDHSDHGGQGDRGTQLISVALGRAIDPCDHADHGETVSTVTTVTLATTVTTVPTITVGLGAAIGLDSCALLMSLWSGVREASNRIGLS